MLNLEPIKARLLAASPGPWREWAESGDYWIGRMSYDPQIDASWICDSNSITAGNTDLIASAPADIANLIEEVERLRVALNTVGTTIYTQGRGTKVEQGLLSFIRKALGRE